MNNKVRFTFALFTSLTEKHFGYKSKFVEALKPTFVWSMLVVFLISNLPIQGNAKLHNERLEDNSSEVMEFNSENERKLETNFTEIINLATPNNSSLIKVASAQNTTEYAVLQIEYKNVLARQRKFTDSKESKIKGVTVLTVFEQFADVFVEVKNKKNEQAFSQITNDPNFLRAEWTTTIPVPPPPPLVRAKYSQKGISEPIIRGGFTDSEGKKLTGRNVVIAVIDTGIDFTHQDFITYDGDGNPTSRILYLWDTTLDFRAKRGNIAPFLYPNGASIGTLFSQEQLTAELRAIKKGEAPNIPLTDEDGHGTACASIAAGNGNADYCEGGYKRPDVVGVAPDALIIGVRIGKDKLTNAYLLNAICEWLDAIAGEKSLVISSSFGGNYTGHDGQSINERELNKRLENGDKKGRIMVAAAGNEAQNSIHAYVNFGSKNKAKLISWKAEKSTEKESIIVRLYFNTSSAKNIKIVRLGNTVIKKEQLIWELNKITNQIQATLKVEPGEGQIRLFNSAGQQTEAHLYFDSVKQGTFNEGVDMNYLVTTPGTAESVITVGSSAWNNNFHRNGNFIELTSSCQDKDKNFLLFEVGKLSCYSSPGPTRDNRYKPDVVAPGEWYTASYAKDSSGWKKERLDSIQKYIPMNGTSAATPYTAGIIALLFEKEPTLTTNQIKELFKNNLTKIDLKPVSSKFPNNNWGNGKLDLEAIKRIFKALNESKASSD